MDDFLRHSEPVSVQYPSNSSIYTAFVYGKVLLANLNIPEIQREIDSEWVETLVTSLIQEYQKQGYFDFSTFSLCYFKNELYLLNGQHRYAALRKIHDLKEYLDIQIKVEVREVTSLQEMNQLWTMTNRSNSVKIVKNCNDQLVINGLLRYLGHNYQHYISKSAKPHKPNINLDHMVEKLEEFQLIEKLKISSDQQLIDLVIQLNNFYGQVAYQLERWRQWKVPDVEKYLDKCRQKSHSKTLYLGIFHNFEWLQRILVHVLEGQDYGDMPHYLINRQPRKTSQHLRDLVWKKRNNSLMGKCFVCQSPLEFKDFQCGHIKAYF